MNKQLYQELLKLVNTEAGRFLLGKLGQKPEYSIVKITKNSFTERLDKKTYRSTFYSHQPILELFLPITTKMQIANEEYEPINNLYEAFLHYSYLETKNYKYPQIFLTTTTFNPAVGANSPVNGEASESTVDVAFATIRAAAGNQSTIDTTANPCARINCSNTTDQFSEMVRGIFLFDTSSIGAGATGISGTFSLYGTGKTDNLSQSIGVTSSSPAANNTLANSDYAIANFGSTRFATDITFTNWSTSAYNDFALNASGITAISLTGITKFGTRISADIDNSAPTWSAGVNAQVIAQYASETNKPKLVVTYTPASVATTTDEYAYFL